MNLVKTLNLLACLAASAIGCAQHVTSADTSTTATRIERWRSLLSSLSANEGTQLFIPFDYNAPVPSPFNERLGRLGMDVLAHYLTSKWSVVDGCVVFNPQPVGHPTGTHVRVKQLLDMLGSGRINDLVSPNGVELGGLEPTEAFAFAADLGLPPDIYSGFAANLDGARAGARLVIDVQYSKPDGSVGSYRLGNSTRPSWMMTERPRVPQNELIPINGVPIEESTGSLDFGPGQILQIAELRELAYREFDVNYAIDPRVSASYLFVSGKFDLKKFESCMSFALQVHDPLIQDANLAEMSFDELMVVLGGAVDALSQVLGTDAKALIEHRSVLGSSIAGIDAGFASHLRAQGLDPSLITVLLRPAFLFHFSAPGKTATEGAKEGVPLPAGAVNILHNFTYAYRG